MVAKLVTLAAAMAAIVVLTHAAVKITVINTEVEEGSSNQMGQRRLQLRSQWPDKCGGRIVEPDGAAQAAAGEPVARPMRAMYLTESMRYGPGQRYRRGVEI